MLRPGTARPGDPNGAILKRQAAAKHVAAAWVVVLALAAGAGGVWWKLLPSWTAPDEPGHYLFAWQLADPGGSRSARERAILESLRATGWWRYNRLPEPAGRSQSLADDPVLAASGDQSLGEPRLYYAVPAYWLRENLGVMGRDPAASLRLMRLQSWVLHLLATAAALLLAQVVWPGRRDRAWEMGLMVGLWPLAGFAGASFNNDALALFAGAAAFTLLMAAWLDGQAGMWAAALLVVGLGPVVVDVGLLYLWPLTAVLAALRLIGGFPARRLAIILFSLALLVLFLPDPRWAAGWRSSGGVQQTRMNGVLALAPKQTEPGGQKAAIVQVVGGKNVLALREQPLALEVNVTGSPASQVLLVVQDSVHEVRLPCTPGEECAAAFVPDRESTYLRVEATATDPVQLAVTLRTADGRNLLFNGDGRQPDQVGRSLFRQLERWLPVPSGYFSRLGWESAWNAPSQFRYIVYALFAAAGFWGHYGWLSRPLPIPLYLIAATLALAAVAGLVSGLPARIRRQRTDAATREDRAVLASVLAVGFILLQTLLPMVGQAWQPQGRYLLPALAPIALLLLLGWEAIWPAAHCRWRIPVLAAGLLAWNLASWWVILP